MTARGMILVEADKIISVDRNVQYGEPERNFERIAQMWSAFKGITFEPHEVAAMLVMLKLARIAVSPEKVDHWVDIAGYAACGGEVRPAQDTP